MMETGRIPDFDNGGLPVRTSATNSLGGIYYANPLKEVSNSDLLAWLTANAGSPQVVADASKEYNLSRSRISAVTGQSIEAVDSYFNEAGVKPWWATSQQGS